MKHVMGKHIRHLFNEYISRKITSEDRRRLKDSVLKMSDKELGETLSEVWEEYDGKMDRLTDWDLIVKKINPEKKRRYTLKKVALIAAAILLPILIGFQVYYYKDNKRLNDFIAREVMMKVESGEKADITLPDGTKVFLNAATTISYPIDYGLKTRNIKLTGEAYLEVTENKQIPFLLDAGPATIKVLGTKFNVNAYKNSDIIETTLIEGSVRFTTKGTIPKTILLSPNEKAIYYKDTDVLDIKKTTTHFETAWLKGELVFRSVKFQEIVSKLRQRYGVDIEIKNIEKCSQDLFTGSFKEDYANGVLKILQMHYDFTYTDTNGKILITFR